MSMIYMLCVCALFLADLTEEAPVMVCGTLDNCLCDDLKVICDGLPLIPSFLRTEKALETTNWIPGNDTELDLLTGYSEVTIYGNTTICQDDRLSNFSRPNCELLSTILAPTSTGVDTPASPVSDPPTTLKPTSTSASTSDSAQSDTVYELLNDLKTALKEQILQYMVAGIVWTFVVCLTSFVLVQCLIQGLLHTYQRMNKLHVIRDNDDDTPCIIRFALWQKRTFIKMLRICCCCRKCKTLTLPTLTGIVKAKT